MLLPKRLALFTVAALLGLPSCAIAECGSYRLVGSWRLYVQPSSNSWLACELKILPSGKIGGKSSCRGSNLSATDTTGEFVVKNCVITGQFTVGSKKYVIEHASYSVDESNVYGIIKLGTAQFAEFMSLKQ